MKSKLVVLLSFLSFGASSEAASPKIGIRSEIVPHVVGEKKFESYVAWDAARKGARPAILIVHDWMGLGDQTRDKAKQLAAMGYVAMAADVYGVGNLPKDTKEAAAIAGRLRGGDRAELRNNIRSAYDALRARKDVDPRHVVVMGYCFGGTTALELARTGAELAGTASFHGGLSAVSPDDGGNIKGPVLILHGADDPNVPPSEVAGLQEELRKGGVNFKFVSYPGAVHSFTNPKAGNDNSKGAAYNAEADRKSWVEFKNFLAEVAPGK